MHRLPRSTLFPYTTLFRSLFHWLASKITKYKNIASKPSIKPTRAHSTLCIFNLPGIQHRSEEHTSELQSRENLVCRLLLEKKKRTIQNTRLRVIRCLHTLQ